MRIYVCACVCQRRVSGGRIVMGKLLSVSVLFFFPIRQSMSMHDLSTLILLTSRDFVSEASIADIHVANATCFDFFFLLFAQAFFQKVFG